ncbi:MAG: CDGSH iron-sulfur domain-containing protein [Gammaproteobacteria bacterium]|nr:CDGSH iron-sulfur domain-containing protein [Gammaproteobacteria bacterium]MBU1654709.1 CDGSH iron-sulfur domain-containing protein [Gammaproteobacteria bacterium]MBU1959630.1 CDGSH iron-sulfur domain-containing protein [Gammaproteobacteria bacterium]
MSNPVIAQKAPFRLELSPGEYWWCACGRSKKQPHCDGSHQGTGIVPVNVKLTEPKAVWLCGCKQTGEAPFCDGSHNMLE